MTEQNDYISVTQKYRNSNDNEGRMIERNVVEIQGTFLVKIQDNTFNEAIRENVFEHINKFLQVVGPIKINGVSQDQFRLSIFSISLADTAEIEEDDDPDDITDIFKIEGNLFYFETPLCEAFNNFNYLLRIDKDLVPYQLCDHICEPYRFKNGVTKWPTCSSDIDGFGNSGELPGMVRGNATPGVIKLRAWLINSFGNFHELDYNVLVKLQECWWKINTYEVTPFTRLESYGHRPYANIKTEMAHDPYHEVNNIFGRNYDTSNTKDNQGHEERRDDPTLEPLICKIRRFEMMKYSFNADEEYIAIKESEYLNHSKDNLDAYRELLRIIDEGWVMETPDEDLALRKIDNMVYSEKEVCRTRTKHSEASSTHFAQRTQIGESSRATYQGSSSF
ncbi:hypothetical protein Tco_0548164 [Tanacetum coccineum]